MHIVILADPVDNQSAGVHVYTKNLIENLLKIDHDNTYSFIHEKENPFFVGKNHYIIAKRKGLGSGTIRKFFSIPKLLKKLKPDLVFEPCHIGPFRVPTGCKKATMIHDLTPILFPHFHIKRSSYIHKLLLKRILKNSDLILTASKTTKRDIEKYSSTMAPIKVIPLGVDHLDQAESPTRTIKEPYILYLGTIEPRKNLDTLIDAFNELELSHKLVLAGKIGWKAEKILEKARKNPDIILTKFVNNKERDSLYKFADAFIYPSIYEGFGLPPLEAMSHGTPVISSTGGSLKEILKDKVLFFDPSDKETLKKHIQSVLKSKPSVDQNFPKQFSWHLSAEKTLKAFQEICDK